MKEEKPARFNSDHAARYDKLNEKIAALNNSMHLFTRIILSELPEEAKILCIGAGTGAELLYLAKEFPGWHFTAVEPSEPMLNVCRKKAADIGITQRCTFHHGYLDSLNSSGQFNAATSFLVSQFIIQKDDRINFFKQIADSLLPDGILVSSDLSHDINSPDYEKLLDLWLRLLKFSEWPAENLDKLPEVYKTNVSVLPHKEVEGIIESAGFNKPVKFLQNGLISAWFSRKPI